MKSKIEHHFFVTSSAEVDTLCTPLKIHFHLTSFVFQRIYPNGQEIRLSNQPKWLIHFYNQHLYQQSNFQSHPQSFQSGFVLWQDLQDHSPILQEAKAFNIDHGITLCTKYEDYVEHYFFGTEQQNHHVTQLYLNNLDLLERFVMHFKDRGKQLIQEAEKHKIYLKKNVQHLQDINESATIFSQNTFDRDGFLHATTVDNIIISPTVALTRRELDCIRMLLQGYTAKESGERLFLSKRTVETHLERIKEKLFVHSKSELIQKLTEMGFSSKPLL